MKYYNTYTYSYIEKTSLGNQNETTLIYIFSIPVIKPHKIQYSMNNSIYNRRCFFFFFYIEDNKN
jgi:hypothetical protein